jgi:hypothetical protein
MLLLWSQCALAMSHSKSVCLRLHRSGDINRSKLQGNATYVVSGYEPFLLQWTSSQEGNSYSLTSAMCSVRW